MLASTELKRDWRVALWAAGVGLFIGRLWADFGPAPWPAGPLIAAGLTVLCAGAGLRWTHRARPQLAPLAAGYVYAFWPKVDPHVAGAVAVIVALGLILAHGQWRRRLLPEPLVFLAGLTVYVTTLAPSVLPADSGEFQLVSRTLGIAHPPGYPLYTLLGWAFTWLPVGDPAWRVNLLSAVLAAATLALVTRAGSRLTGSTAAALVGTLALGAAVTFWAQATTANIRTLTALFTALLLVLLSEYQRWQKAGGREQGAGGRRREGTRILYLASFSFGLAVTHHGSLAFLGLPAVAYVLLTTPRILTNRRVLLRLAAAFVAALPVLAYLPIRGAVGAPLNPGGLTTAPGFLRHVLALGFRGDLFYFTRPADLADRLLVLGDILRIQFGWPLLALAALGLIHLALRQRMAAVLLAGTFLVNAGVAITYRAPQTVEYLLPSYVALALLMAVGAAAFHGQILRGNSLSRVALAALLTLGLWNAWERYPSFRALSRDHTTRAYAEGVLEAAPPGALILSNWHHVTAFWYLQQVERLRPDVQVSYISPHGDEPIGETWRRRVSEAATGPAPVILASRYNEFASLPYRLVPFHGAFWLETQPTTTLPAGASPADATFDPAEGTGPMFRLRGYHVQTSEVSPDFASLQQGFSVRPGQALGVTLFWEPTGAVDRDYSVFVHLVDESGTVWGQQDTTPAADAWQPGALLIDQHTIPLLPHVAPGRYQLIAGLYITRPNGTWQRLRTPDGGDFVRLAEVTVLPASQPPASLHPQHVRWTGGTTLVGVDFDHSLPESRRLYLHWWRPAGSREATIRLYAGREGLAQGTLPATQVAGYLTTAHDLPPAVRGLDLELAGADGSPLVARGPWGVPARRCPLPEPRPAQRYLLFGGEMALTGASLQGHTVDLQWLALRPLTRDYSVSVQALGPGWRAQDDGTPALGAIPTLKWIRGIQVRDRHRLTRPEGAKGQGALTVAVYDAFTLEPLIVLDDRFLKLGQGQGPQVGQWAE